MDVLSRRFYGFSTKRNVPYPALFPNNPSAGGVTGGPPNAFQRFHLQVTTACIAKMCLNAFQEKKYRICTDASFSFEPDFGRWRSGR